MIETNSILLILLIVSFVFNLFFISYIIFLKVSAKKLSDISFDEAFYILDSIIRNQKQVLFRGLSSLSKKFRVLTNNGTNPPNDSVEEYSKKKKELKTAITKKIFRLISPNVRKKILIYYTESGLINYVVTELEKNINNDIGGLGN